MSFADKSLFSSDQLSPEMIDQVFSRAKLFKDEFQAKKRIDHLVRKDSLNQMVLALVFAEPSTRTRMSFQMAAARLGVRTLVLDNPASASLSKGETWDDTLRNIAAMKPDVMVVRYNNDLDADAAVKEFPFPIISGGIGTAEHPTQALADAFTIKESHGQVKGEKVLIVGDVRHSRVANSDLSLLSRMGAEIAYCSPKEFVPSHDQWKSIKYFSSLDEGLDWASVAMALRIQKERHQSGVGLSVAEYREQYRIGNDQLKRLGDKGILLHPGPVIRGVEISATAMSDSRCKILDQVTNGVFVRAALISLILDLEVQKS